jgi:hypothetical protein
MVLEMKAKRLMRLPFAKKVTAAFPNLRFVGRWLLFGEVSHFAYGIVFDPRLSPRCLAMFLDWFPLSGFTDGDVYGPVRRAVTFSDKSDICLPMDDETYADKVIELIETQAIPHFQTFNNTRSFIDHALVRIPIVQQGSWPEIDTAWCQMYLGQFEAAIDNIALALNSAQRGPILQRLLTTRRFVLAAACKELMLKGDRPTLADYMHEREREMAAFYSLDALWKRERFPFEE